ncbi:hypothetical protein PSYMO_33525, partial [Pseudomonas amygdali pv. mori str. 301020]
KVEAGRLWLSGIDLLDGTPVLDIKPYVPYADAIAEATNHIASACACSLTVAKAFIKKLREHGYLTIEKRRIHGCVYSNSMTITRDLILASMSPLEAIPKPVAVTSNPGGERV